MRFAYVITLIVGIVLAAVPAVADCPAAAIEWVGGGADDFWSTAENWEGNNVPNDDTEDACNDIGGTIIFDLATETINSFTIDGVTDGELIIQEGNQLNILDDLVVPTSGFDALYEVTLEEGAELNVADDIYNGLAWTVNDGAKVSAAGFAGLDEISPNSGLPDVCAAVWTIDDGQVEVSFAEKDICWNITGGDGPLDEEILSDTKIVARTLRLTQGAEVTVGTPGDDYGILQAAGAETILDASTVWAVDLKTKVLDSFNLATTTLKNDSSLEIEELTGDPLAGDGNGSIKPSLGALFYGDASSGNEFTSHADDTIFRHIFDGSGAVDRYKASIISKDPRGTTSPGLMFRCEGNLKIQSRTDRTFEYTINVGEQNEDTVQASWDSSGVDLVILGGTAQDPTEATV